MKIKIKLLMLLLIIFPFFTSCSGNNKVIYKESNENAALSVLHYVKNTTSLENIGQMNDKDMLSFKMVSGNSSVLGNKGKGKVYMCYSYTIRGTKIEKSKSFDVTNYGIVNVRGTEATVVSNPVDVDACPNFKSSESRYVDVKLVNRMFKMYNETGKENIVDGRKPDSEQSKTHGTGTNSLFYKRHLLSYEELVKKVDANGEKDVLIVIFIKEKNEKCERCVNQQKDFDTFFSDGHTTEADGRNYNVAVLDIAADEFDEDKVKDNEALRSVHEDVIKKWNLDNAWNNMPSEFNAPSGGDLEEFIDLNSDDPLPTPAIARFDGNTCVGVAMGYGSYDKFLRFCYADDVNDSQNSFQSVPGEK